MVTFRGLSRWMMRKMYDFACFPFRISYWPFSMLKRAFGVGLCGLECVGLCGLDDLLLKSNREGRRHG